MPVTYKKIASVTVGSGGAASMEFTSIPGTYTDLVLHLTGRYDGSTYPNALISINGSTSNFSSRVLYGDGAAAGSTDAVPRFISYNPGSSQTASTFGSTTAYFTNYAGSTNKSYSSDTVQETNGATAYSGLVAGLWSQTAAITQITVSPSTGNWVQYSTAVLYGISKS